MAGEKSESLDHLQIQFLIDQFRLQQIVNNGARDCERQSK